MAGSTVERRWVETNGVWHLFRINTQDPRYADSEPYDAEQENNGQPTKSLAELRAERDGDGGQAGEVKTAARQPAAKKTAPAAKKTARRAADAGDGSSASDPAAGSTENDPAADGGSGTTEQ